MKEGLSSILKKIEGRDGDFYKAIRIVIEGVVAYSERLSKEAGIEAEKTNDPNRRDELQKISRICKKVPMERAETLEEALQAIWIVHIAFIVSIQILH